MMIIDECYVSYSANQILGKPNVYPRYGNIAGTWTQNGGQLDRVHFIEVSFFYKDEYM